MKLFVGHDLLEDKLLNILQQKNHLDKLKRRLTQIDQTFTIYLKKNEAISKKIQEQKQENLSFIDR